MEITVLGSGSRGNATIVRNSGSMLLIDFGFTRKKLAERMKEAGYSLEDISAVVITHEHADHVKGLEVFAKRHKIPVYMNNGTFLGLRGSTKQSVRNNVTMFETGEILDICGFSVKSIPLVHDTNDPVGFTISDNGCKLAYVTDTGRISGPLRDTVRESDGIIIESNHDIEMLWKGRYPEVIKHRVAGPYGHLSNTEAGELLAGSGIGDKSFVILAHLSQENNRPEKALKTVRSIIEQESNEFPGIFTADQDSVSDKFML